MGKEEEDGPSSEPNMRSQTWTTETQAWPSSEVRRRMGKGVWEEVVSMCWVRVGILGYEAVTMEDGPGVGGWEGSSMMDGRERARERVLGCWCR